MKKFQNLGTALSREQSKQIKGGDECLDCGGDSGGHGGACSAIKCTYPEIVPGGGTFDREGSCGKQPMHTACTCNGYASSTCTGA